MNREFESLWWTIDINIFSLHFTKKIKASWNEIMVIGFKNVSIFAWSPLKQCILNATKANELYPSKHLGMNEWT